MKVVGIVFLLLLIENSIGNSQNLPGNQILFPSYNGLLMCGYQGWFRAVGDDSGQGWGHYGVKGKFDPQHLTIDIWPEMKEYKRTYKTAFKLEDGSEAEIFSSVDPETTHLHFSWMQEYGVDGVFMQRFFGYCRNERTRKIPDRVLKNALAASHKYQRAIAVMYDLSGLDPQKDNCDVIIEDWKHLVDNMKVKNFGEKQTYLHHNGKPLVAIWGLGFPDRPYDINDIGIEKLIDFLKNDPEYGGCSVMVGVPTYFRELDSDCIADPYLHEVICMADIVMPWMVGRFTLNLFGEETRYEAHLKKDMEWCENRGVDYVPCIYPGFSWGNLSKIEFAGKYPMNQIPRLKGRFFWEQIRIAIGTGATMLYVAMFDEIDEATAIFKCTNKPPVNASFIDYEGVPSDYYLKMTGIAAKALKKKVNVPREKPDYQVKNACIQ